MAGDGPAGVSDPGAVRFTVSADCGGGAGAVCIYDAGEALEGLVYPGGACGACGTVCGTYFCKAP